MRTSTWILICAVMIAGCSKPMSDASKAAPQASDSASSPSDQTEKEDIAITTMPDEDNQAAEPIDEVPDPLADETADPLTTSLSVGDLAPEVRVGGWALNEPENGEAALANGKVRVVEFWATWCGPCLVSMPHLNELAEKYRDSVTVVGVTDEDEATVTAFLDQPSKTADGMPWRDLLTYALAFDGNRYLGEQLFSATGQQGIPAAFIIGEDGYLLWYGHPMTMDDPLEQIVAGTWNAANAVAKMEEIEKAEEELSRLISALMSAQRDADWDRALTVLDELVADESRAAMLGPNAVLMRYEMLTRGGKSEQARVMADEIRSQRWDDANFLGAMAWAIATRYPKDMRDLDFAMQAASRAVELTNEEDGSVVDTLARVFYETGDLDTAIEWQRKAVVLNDDPRIQEALDQFLIERAKTVEAEQQGIDAGEEPNGDAEVGGENMAEPTDTESTEATELNPG